jgi:large subunit ribosomal protein L4
MKIDVVKLDAGKAGSVDLDDAIFGIEEIRADILQRAVKWQLSRRQAGTHKTKERSEISRTKRSLAARRAAVAHVTARARLRSSWVAVWPMVRAFAATRPSFPKRCARWPEARSVFQGWRQAADHSGRGASWMRRRPRI